ncbi:MAG: lysophospholipid acyltransferase family protein [Candidatus Nanoarchaeia archaeon]|nr:lysophospholipid acyltransferase family protein [Candidatus Nanoarchaeia archaeon]
MVLNDILSKNEMRISENYLQKNETRNLLTEKFDKKYEAIAPFAYYFFKMSNALTINGYDNIEEVKDSSCVIVANHTSSLDPMYIIAALKDYGKIRWLSKKENFEKKLFKYFLDIGQVIPLSETRGLNDYVIQRVDEVFEKKEKLALFPEGTRSQSGDGILGDFKLGAVKFCVEYNVPYVPVAIVGKKIKPFRGKVTINIGKPVYLDTSKEINYVSAAMEMRERIIALKEGNLDYAPKQLA